MESIVGLLAAKKDILQPVYFVGHVGIPQSKKSENSQKN